MRRMRWAGHAARTGEEIKVYSVLVVKPEGKRSVGRPGRRWQVGIRMDRGEISWGGGVQNYSTLTLLSVTAGGHDTPHPHSRHASALRMTRLMQIGRVDL
jgi:hypothetical protein